MQLQQPIWFLYTFSTIQTDMHQSLHSQSKHTLSKSSFSTHTRNGAANPAQAGRKEASKHLLKPKHERRHLIDVYVTVISSKRRAFSEHIHSYSHVPRPYPAL
jgi:hypothetical protein